MDSRKFTYELRTLFGQLLPLYIGGAHSRTGTKIKDDGTPVGNLDKDTLQALRDLISNHFPDHYTIGEEDELNGEQMRAILARRDQHQWSIDGLDGTGNLRLRLNSYGAMIALRKGDDIIYSAIFRPVDERLRGNGFYYAELGKGAWQWCKECLCHHRLLRDPLEKTGRRVVMLEGSSKKFFRDPISGLGREMTVRPGFSSCVAITTVIQEGREEAPSLVMVENKPWDIWPALLFTKEYGGIVTDLHGNPVTPENCGSIVASANEEDHAATLKLLM